MIGFLLTGHGHFGTGMFSALQLVTGARDFVQAVDFEEGHSIETLAANLDKAMDALADCDGILVFSDLPGGSPFKTAVECAQSRPEGFVEVLAGSNLPMMVEGFTMMEDYDSALELAKELLETGRDAVLRFALVERAPQEEAEDGI